MTPYQTIILLIKPSFFSKKHGDSPYETTIFSTTPEPWGHHMSISTSGGRIGPAYGTSGAVVNEMFQPWSF